MDMKHLLSVIDNLQETDWKSVNSKKDDLRSMSPEELYTEFKRRVNIPKYRPNVKQFSDDPEGMSAEQKAIHNLAIIKDKQDKQNYLNKIRHLLRPKFEQDADKSLQNLSAKELYNEFKKLVHTPGYSPHVSHYDHPPTKFSDPNDHRTPEQKAITVLAKSMDRRDNQNYFDKLHDLLQSPKSSTNENKLAKYMKLLAEAQEVETLPAVAIEENPVDSVTVDIPLLIRLLEYSREDAKTDMDLHNVAERMIEMSKEGKTLSMDDYDAICSSTDQSTEQPDLDSGE